MISYNTDMQILFLTCACIVNWYQALSPLEPLWVLWLSENNLSLFSPIGTSDFRKELDVEAWAFCYIHHSCKAPVLFPEEFARAATAVLDQDFLNITNSYQNLHFS